ncbi:unnamed protein product [Ceratitis capitata]|uniref:(Mediterranean fruit fly) hypothetical protein n=1 Tax=Ceratitis capitata TaxID=7213 RepID=A0A811UJV0_CERCA|nr:unnamed protein product [Ceratitis capitata]
MLLLRLLSTLRSFQVFFLLNFCHFHFLITSFVLVCTFVLFCGELAPLTFLFSFFFSSHFFASTIFYCFCCCLWYDIMSVHTRFVGWLRTNAYNYQVCYQFRQPPCPALPPTHTLSFSLSLLHTHIPTLCNTCRTISSKLPLHLLSCKRTFFRSVSSHTYTHTYWLLFIKFYYLCTLFVVVVVVAIFHISAVFVIIMRSCFLFTFAFCSVYCLRLFVLFMKVNS